MWVGRILQTDTASVLMEAIGYIKFLQNQVEVYFHFPINILFGSWYIVSYSIFFFLQIECLEQFARIRNFDKLRSLEIWYPIHYPYF